MDPAKMYLGLHAFVEEAFRSYTRAEQKVRRIC